MSIIWNEHDEAFISDFIGDGVEIACFACHKPPTFPMMHWAGTSHIIIHPECFDTLYSRMLRDRIEILNSNTGSDNKKRPA